MASVKNLGQGVAPDVSWAEDRWLVAIGPRDGIDVLSLSPDGVHTRTDQFKDGWGFPVVRWPWLMYKANEAHGWIAMLRNLATGAEYKLSTAHGNHPCALTDDYAFWQSEGPFGVNTVYRTSLSNPGIAPSVVGPGAPDGIAWGNADGTVALMKDIRFSETGMQRPQHVDGCTIGENEQGGIVARMPGREAILIPGTDTKTPRLAKGINGQFAAVAWGEEGINLVIFTADDLISDPPQPVVDILVRAYPRKVWVAPYKSRTAQHGDTPPELYAGNANHVEGRPGDPLAVQAELQRVGDKYGMPIIMAADSPPQSHVDLIVAFLLHGSNMDDLRNQYERVIRDFPEKPIMAYMDDGRPEFWSVERPAWATSDRFWPSFPAYRNPGEPLSAFRARCEALLTRFDSWGCYQGLTPGFFTRNGAVTPDFMVECMPLYNEWMQRYQINSFMPFCDRRPSDDRHRDQGTWDRFPIFRRYAMAFAAAAPANRPNRFDYWTPSGGAKESLANKLRQDIDLAILSPSERAYLLKLMVEGGDDEEPEEPKPGEIHPELLKDQSQVVADKRRELFPEFFQPGHRNADAEGWIPLNLITPDDQIKHSDHVTPAEEKAGHDRCAVIAHAVGQELKKYGLGLVKAKPGSKNHGIPFPGAPYEITTDALAVLIGSEHDRRAPHWDIFIDGAAKSIPTWRLVPQFNDETPPGDNWKVIVPRYIKL